MFQETHLLKQHPGSQVTCNRFLDRLDFILISGLLNFIQPEIIIS